MDAYSFCSANFFSLLTTQVYPITMIAGALAAILIGLSYAASQATSNPKLSVWARTEATQLVISAVFIIILLSTITSFCSFQTRDLNIFTNATSTISKPIYQGAEHYMKEAATYAHFAITETRYYMGVINVEEIYSKWQCPIWCFLSIGGTGDSVSEKAGTSYFTSGFMLLLNSSTMSFFSAFMHIFFLRYVGSGLFLFLLPIGLITRSLPYLRGFGSIILSVLFVFYVIYPTILAVYYVSIPINIPEDRHNENDISVSGEWLSGTYSGPSVHAEDLSNAAAFTIKAFFYAVFLPTAALLSSAAAATYVARLMGEEIDLSRIAQMV